MKRLTWERSRAAAELARAEILRELPVGLVDLVSVHHEHGGARVGVQAEIGEGRITTTMLREAVEREPSIAAMADIWRSLGRRLAWRYVSDERNIVALSGAPRVEPDDPVARMLDAPYVEPAGDPVERPLGKRQPTSRWKRLFGDRDLISESEASL